MINRCARCANCLLSSSSLSSSSSSSSRCFKWPKDEAIAWTTSVHLLYARCSIFGAEVTPSGSLFHALAVLVKNADYSDTEKYCQTEEADLSLLTTLSQSFISNRIFTFLYLSHCRFGNQRAKHCCLIIKCCPIGTRPYLSNSRK